MPKIKTRRSAAKRFSQTGSGKFKRRRQNLRHILTKKAASRKDLFFRPSATGGHGSLHTRHCRVGRALASPTVVGEMPQVLF